MASVFEDLTARGLIHGFSEGLPDHLETRMVTAYAGFDPTAASLHV